MSEIVEEIERIKEQISKITEQIYIIASILLEKERYAQLHPHSINSLNEISNKNKKIK